LISSILLWLILIFPRTKLSILQETIWG